MAPPAPAMAPKTPKARARSLGIVKVVVSTASAVGASSAPNAPCSARPATSTSNVGAAPASADAAANPTRPMMNVRLRPQRSERRPPSSSRLANVSEYAVMIHWRSPSENPRSA